MMDRATRAERRADMLFGGIWLLFLISPVIALVLSEASLQWQAVGWIATVLFSMGYLVSFLYPTPWRLETFGGAAAWAVVLGALGVATIPAVGPYALTFLAFLVAIPVFRLPPPWDAIGALAPITVAIALIVALSGPPYWRWEIPMTLLPLLFMLPLRRLVDGMDRQSELRHELALSRQREQVGRDVHDILGHSLTVIAVKAELAHRLAALDPERARAELADVLELTRSALGEVRTTVTQLQTPGLAPQLAASETALDAAGIRVKRPPHVEDLDDARSHLLAWCLREAVTNVVRHSGASRCEINVLESGLTIVDDGVGLGDTAPGHGLRGMRQRVTDAGGTMVLGDAQPGASRPGTRLEVAL